LRTLSGKPYAYRTTAPPVPIGADAGTRSGRQATFRHYARPQRGSKCQQASSAEPIRAQATRVLVVETSQDPSGVPACKPVVERSDATGPERPRPTSRANDAASVRSNAEAESLRCHNSACSVAPNARGWRCHLTLKPPAFLVGRFTIDVGANQSMLRKLFCAANRALPRAVAAARHCHFPGAAN
jgi:hypothetical protein